MSAERQSTLPEPYASAARELERTIEEMYDRGKKEERIASLKAVVELLRKPDCPVEFVRDIVGNLAVLEDEVDGWSYRMGEALWESEHRWDSYAIMYLMDCSTHQQEIGEGASPELTRKLLDYLTYEEAHEFSLDLLNGLSEEAASVLTREDLMVMLEHYEPGVREAGIRLSQFVTA